MRSFRYYVDAVKYRLTNEVMLHKSQRMNRHVVVFESDDWGSVRMPSLEALQMLAKRGFHSIASCVYSRVDTLASNEDLENLMDVLHSVKDSNGNSAKLTLDCVVANPDFEKIKQYDFTEYFYEPFTETLKRYPKHDRVFDLWREGMGNKMFKPQFHGREHLNFQRWLRFLKERNEEVMACFEAKNYAMVDDATEVLEAYNLRNEREYDLLLHSIEEGLDLFEQLFGFRSLSMIAPCYTWDDCVEDVAWRKGVKYIQGGFVQRYSKFQSAKGKKMRGHYLGERNHNGQIYLTRNCYFEPSQNKQLNADTCLKRIDRLFKMGLPAIVSCHRLNFVGTLSEKNRDENLRDFEWLLKALVKNYPDVEFLSSDELFEY